jgi:hypothetical protein
MRDLIAMDGAREKGERASSEPYEVLALLRDRAWRDLLESVRDALAISPAMWMRSVLGSPNTWLPTSHSEYKILYSWRLPRTARYVADVAVPSAPRIAPAWFPDPLSFLLWHPSQVDQHRDHNRSWTSHPREAWFFINGIMTDRPLAQINADYLADLFHRPITLIQNSTDGLAEDLIECASEKFGHPGEVLATAFPPIYDALTDAEKQRVVVIAHSQGTIIAAVLLRLLRLIYESQPGSAPAARTPHHARAALRDSGVALDPIHFVPITRKELSKLELYCFANCATEMRYVEPARDDPLPWIESYGNEHDIIARLGMIAPHPEARGIVIDGPRYVQEGAWGHLLNRHYLRAIDAAQRKGQRRGPATTSPAPYILMNAHDYPSEQQPRLYRYLNGGASLPDAADTAATSRRGARDE